MCTGEIDMEKKVMKNIAAAVCAGLFVYTLLPFVTGSWYYMMPLPIILMFIRAVCLLILAISLFHGKQIGGFTKFVAVIYAVIELFVMAENLRFGFNFLQILLLALFVGTFLMAVKTESGHLIDTTDTTSQAAMVVQQGAKQEEIYDQQLRDGILTKEEYDMILENKRQIMSENRI